MAKESQSRMNACLISLAEAWRWRRIIGVPALFGAIVCAVLVASNPPQYTGRVLLQLQADQARAPLLQRISAPGHRQAIWAILTSPDILVDSAQSPANPLRPEQLELRVLNDYLIEIGVRSVSPAGLANVTESLGYNFIQALLAPERMRVEQLLADAQAELVRMDALPAPLESSQLEDRARILSATAQFKSDLRLLNTAFGQQGSQALLWFAEGARVVEPLQGTLRWLLWLAAGALLGGALGWLSYALPRRWQPAIMSVQEAGLVTGLPVVGVLPWLNHFVVTPKGSFVSAGGKELKPADFSEIGRLYRTAMRNLRGPLVIVAPTGTEGASTLALLLAEKASLTGKKAVIVDLNLKNRQLSNKLLLGEGTWGLPTQKGKWSALKTLPETDLLALAAPRHNATLQALAEQGGLPKLFETLGQQAETVVIDASPLSATNRGNIDAVTLATHAGRVLIVAQERVTNKAALKQAADQLLLAGAPVHGIVLNQQFSPTHRQLLGHLADSLGWVLPPLGRWLRNATYKATLD